MSEIKKTAELRKMNTFSTYKQAFNVYSNLRYKRICMFFLHINLYTCQKCELQICFEKFTRFSGDPRWLSAQKSHQDRERKNYYSNFSRKLLNQVLKSDLSSTVLTASLYCCINISSENVSELSPRSDQRANPFI